MRKITFLLSLIVAASMLLSACSGATKDPSTTMPSAADVSACLAGVTSVDGYSCADIMKLQPTEKQVAACKLGVDEVEGRKCADILEWDKLFVDAKKCANNSCPLSAAPTATPETINDSTATPEVPGLNVNECFLLGGRNFDYLNKGYETISVADGDWLKAGAPMQMFTSQVVNDGTELAGIETSDEFEIVNDSLQALVCYEGNEWVAYPMPREDTAKVVFYQISWLQYQDHSVKICQDDLGGSGQWTGLCDGNEQVVTTRTSLDELLKLSDFAHYADPLHQAMATSYTFSGTSKLEVLVVFSK